MFTHTECTRAVCACTFNKNDVHLEIVRCVTKLQIYVYTFSQQGHG